MGGNSVENRISTGAKTADNVLSDKEMEVYTEFMRVYGDKVDEIDHLLTTEENRRIIIGTLDEIPGSREALQKWGNITLGIINEGRDE